MEYLQTNRGGNILIDCYLLSKLMYSDNPDVEFYHSASRRSCWRSIKVAEMTTSADERIPKAFAIATADYGDIKVTFVVFRGSQFAEDWWNTNFSAAFTANECGLLHKGFADRARNVPNMLLHSLLKKEGHMIVFTGHSLGGAAAQIAARNFITLLESMADVTNSRIENQFLCLTFASPLVGDEAWRASIDDAYQGNLKRRFIHIVHEQDLVPRFMTLIWNIFMVPEISYLGLSTNIIGIDWAIETGRNIISAVSSGVDMEINVTLAMFDGFVQLLSTMKKIFEWKPSGLFVMVAIAENPVDVDFKDYLKKHTLSFANASTYRVTHKLTGYFRCIPLLCNFRERELRPVDVNAGVEELEERPSSPAVTGGKINVLNTGGSTLYVITLIGSNLLQAVAVTIGGDSFRERVCDTFFRIPLNASNYVSNSELKIVVVPNKQGNHHQSQMIIEMDIYDAFGNSRSYSRENALSMEWSVQCKSSVWYRTPLQLFRMSAILSTLTHDDALFEADPVASAFSCVQELTKAVPFETILYPLALGIPLSTFAVDILSRKVPRTGFVSQLGFSMLQAALKQIDTSIEQFTKELERIQAESSATNTPLMADGNLVTAVGRIGLCAYQVSSVVSPLTLGIDEIPAATILLRSHNALFSLMSAVSATSFIQREKVESSGTPSANESGDDKYSQSKEGLPPEENENESFPEYEEYTNKSQSSYEGFYGTFAGLFRVLKSYCKMVRVDPSSLQNSTYFKAIKDLLANLGAVSVHIQNQLEATLKAKSLVPIYCEFSLETMLSNESEAFLSMGIELRETRKEVKKIKVDLLQELLRLNTHHAGLGRDPLRNYINQINESYQRVAHRINFASFLVMLSAGFIEPESLCTDALKVAYCSDFDPAQIRVRGANWWKTIRQFFEYLGRSIQYPFKSFNCTPEEAFKNWQKVLNSYENIGIEKTLLLHDYNSVVHHFYHYINPTDADKCDVNANISEKEREITQYLRMKNISYLNDPKQVMKDWSNYFNFKINLKTKMQEVDKRFAAIDQRDRYSTCCRLKLILIVYRLREALSNFNIVGFFGESAGGKSTTISMLGVPQIDHGDRLGDRTPFPGLYRYPGKERTFILDTVGYQPRELLEGDYAHEIIQLNEDLMFLCNIVVLIVAYSSQRGFLQNKLVQTTTTEENCRKLNASDISFITCFNKSDYMVQARYISNQQRNPPVQNQSVASMVVDESKERNSCLRPPPLERTLIPETVYDIQLDGGGQLNSIPKKLVKTLSTTDATTAGTASAFSVGERVEYINGNNRCQGTITRIQEPDDIDSILASKSEPFPRWMTCFGPVCDDTDDEMSTLNVLTSKNIVMFRKGGIRNVDDLKRWIDHRITITFKDS